MARFQFRLEKVRKVKMLLEDRAKNTWAQSHNYVLQEQAKLEKLQVEKAAIIEFGYTQTDVTIRMAMYTYIGDIDKQIAVQQNQILQAIKEEEQAREAWVLARQEREVLDKLHEKALSMYTLNQLRVEQSQIDELANTSPKI